MVVCMYVHTEMRSRNWPSSPIRQSTISSSWLNPAVIAVFVIVRIAPKATSDLLPLDRLACATCWIRSRVFDIDRLCVNLKSPLVPCVEAQKWEALWWRLRHKHYRVSCSRFGKVFLSRLPLRSSSVIRTRFHPEVRILYRHNGSDGYQEFSPERLLWGDKLSLRPCQLMKLQHHWTQLLLLHLLLPLHQRLCLLDRLEQRERHRPQPSLPPRRQWK